MISQSPESVLRVLREVHTSHKFTKQRVKPVPNIFKSLICNTLGSSHLSLAMCELHRWL